MRHIEPNRNPDADAFERDVDPVPDPHA